MIRLSDYVMAFIAAQGVDHVFLLPGGGCMHLVDALGRNKDLRYVCNLHEQAVSIAVEAYAQYNSNLGVGLVTTGPGGTNAVTGIAAAWVDSTPCLMISGQVKREDLIGSSGLRQRGMQEIDIISIVRPITKYAETVFEPMSIRYHLEKALHIAREGRPGPVWLDIPLDIQGAIIDEEILGGFTPPSASIYPPDPYIDDCVNKTIKLLTNSKRPCMLVGNGIRLAKAEDKLRKLIDIVPIPILTTWKAMDLVEEEHPHYYGRPGSLGQRGANFIQQNCDFLLTLGARLDFGQTGYSHVHFAPKANKIIVDIDPCETNKLEMPDLISVNMDVGVFLEELIQHLQGQQLANNEDWAEYCRSVTERYPIVEPGYYGQSDYVNPYVLIDVLSNHLDESAIIVPGSSGMCSEVTMQAFRVKKGQRILNNQGFGSMGFGLPASLGVCMASDQRPVICINGDGGFQLNIQELQTVSRLRLPIKFFVLNNRGYGSITNTQRNYFNGFYVASEESSGLTLPDVCKLAEAYGIATTRISNHQELIEQIAGILTHDGPMVCDVMIDPLQIAQPRMSSVKMEDGTMVSKPLEDLWPFLNRDELQINMLD